MSAAKRKPRAKELVVAEPAPMNIVTAFDDPDLFGKFFTGDTWGGWRTVLKAMFALPMDETETTFFKSIAGERDAPTSAVREFWAVAGRRGGKDSITSFIAAYVASTFTGQARLRAGEKAVVMCVAPDRETAKLVLNYTRAYFVEIPLLQGMLIRETAIGFELNNGVDIQILTGNYRSVRGRACLLCILDEVAWFRDENSATPDEELLKAITPSLASLPGSMVIGISSPYRKSVLLFKKHQRHFGKDDDVLVIQAPTSMLNPTIDPALIAREIAEDPAAKRAEWLAEFRDDIGGWLQLEIIEAAVDVDITVRPPSMAFDYIGFADLSGGKNDSATCAIAHREVGTAVLDCIVEVPSPHSPTEAVAQIAAVLKSYRLSSVTGDRYGSGLVIDAFAAAGITYHASERDRSTIYSEALPMFTSGTIGLLDSQRLVDQLANLERRTSPGGRDKIDHPRGQRDDVANSACGALVLAVGKSNKPQLFFTSVESNYGVNSSRGGSFYF